MVSRAAPKRGGGLSVCLRGASLHFHLQHDAALPRWAGAAVGTPRLAVGQLGSSGKGLGPWCL